MEIQNILNKNKFSDTFNHLQKQVASLIKFEFINYN